MWLPGRPHDPSFLQVVTDNEKVFIDPLTDSLTVNQATREDGGVYSCVARNNAGLAEFSVPVYVQDIMSEWRPYTSSRLTELT